MSFDDIEKPIVGHPRMRKGERVRYVPNHRSFGAFIRSEGMRDVTAEVAEDIAALAASYTPSGRRRSKRSSGLHARVKRGYKVKREAGLMKVAGNLRVKVTVVNNADGAALLEFGGRGLKRSRALARAGAKFGDFKPEEGRPS